MNWSKAKTILIIIFLIADIYLFYELYTGTILSRNIIEKENTQEVINFFDKQGISITNAIPKSSLPKPTLTVRYKYLDKNYVLMNFFDSSTNVKINNYDDRIAMENDNLYIEINRNGEFIYTNKVIMESPKNTVDEKAALNNINEFLKKVGIDQSSIYEETKTIDKGYLEMRCSQGYKDAFLDKSYLEIEAANEGVFYMKMLWFETVNNGKTKNEIILPIKALMKLSELYNDSEQNITVSDISLGYYFNTYIEQVKEFDVAAVKEGTAIPVWRIKTDVGDIYINAYNGIVEKN